MPMSNNENQDKQHNGGQKSNLVTFDGKLHAKIPLMEYGEYIGWKRIL
jgi:hypothetical protein